MVFKERKKWNSVATTGVWQPKGMKTNPDKARRRLCLGEEVVIHIGLYGNWKMENDIFK